MKNNLWKKACSVWLSLGLMLSICFAPIANESHWAYATALQLAENGVVSGYGDGDFRLDHSILRSEFIKIVNRAFSYTQKANTSFLDVQEDKWYYEEMLIAKKAGYIQGDESGNAFPENNITRAEAAVALARLLGLSSIDGVSFSDGQEIPDWALVSVGAMVQAGLIRGYENGAFGPMNAMTRGEGFALIQNILKYRRNIETESVEVADDIGASLGHVLVKPFGNSSYSGGPSGGGGSKTASAPVIKQYLNGILEWNEALGSDSYVIRVRIEGEAPETLSTTKLSENITALFGKATMNRNNASEDFYISVMSKGKAGYADSDYSKEIKVNVSFDSVEAPELRARYGKANEVGRCIVEWDDTAHANSYTVTITNEDLPVSTDLYEYDSAKNKITIPNTSFITDNTYLSVVAVSSDPANYKNSQPKTLKLTIESMSGEVQDGTAEYPYIINSSEEFAAINNMNAFYEIRSDIKVTTPLGNAANPFSGTIIGKKDGTNYKPTVTLDITEGAVDTPTGFVARLEGGTIQNLEFDGSISLSYANHPNFGGIGAVCGSMNGGTILDCINRATIENYDRTNAANTSFGSTVGGIVGSILDNRSKIENCVNYGEIRGTRSMGGIAAHARGATIKNCVNKGNVQKAADYGIYAGGMVGLSYSITIENCANYGDITTSTENAGGIIGLLIPNKESTVSECFNAGKITRGGGGHRIGGIVGWIGSSSNGYENSLVTISNCFNSGELVPKAAASAGQGAIVGEMGHTNAGRSNNLIIKNCYGITDKSVFGSSKNTEDQLECLNNYYLNTSDHKGANGEVYCKGITEEQLKQLLATDTSFDGDIWGIKEDYAYPQLKNNPYTKADFVTPEIKNIAAVRNGTDITFTWELPENVSAIKVQVMNNSEILVAAPEQALAIDAQSFVLESAVPNCWYEIFITLDFSDDSDTLIIRYENYLS